VCRTYDLSVHDMYMVYSKTFLLSLYLGFTPGLWWCPCCSFFLICCVVLPVSLDCPILIYPSGFSNGYLLNIGIHHNWASDMYIDAIIHEPKVTIIRGRWAYVLRRTMLWDSKRFHGVVIYHPHQYKRRDITQTTIIISFCWQSSRG